MKPIPNYAGYFASEDGEIYSRRRRLRVDGVLRKLKKCLVTRKQERFYIYLCDSIGTPKRFTVAELVLSAFVSPRPEGMHACHGPKGSLVDSVDNLYWATPKQNMRDKERDGTHQAGDRSAHHTLNSLQVRIIRRSIGKDGLNMTELGRLFGVAHQTIRRIKLRESWKHI